MSDRTYIDGNSIGYAAAQRKGRKLSSGSLETTAIYGALQTMRNRLERNPGTAPVVLWDGRSWRYDPFPDYKGNRTATPEQVAERERYKAQKKYILKGLYFMGVPQLIADNMEADDLAALLTKRAVAQGHSVTLVTGDKDWIQLVDKGVIWDDHKMDRRVTIGNFAEFTGFKTRKAFVHCKALEGDAGDNIKPNTGIGGTGAQQLMRVFEDVHEFQACSQEDAVARWVAAGFTVPRVKKTQAQTLPAKFQALRDDPEVRARFEWALSLVDLHASCIPAPINMRIIRKPIDKPSFIQFCGELGFHSFLRDVDAWLAPFQEQLN